MDNRAKTGWRAVAPEEFETWLAELPAHLRAAERLDWLGTCLLSIAEDLGRVFMAATKYRDDHGLIEDQIMLARPFPLSREERAYLAGRAGKRPPSPSPADEPLRSALSYAERGASIARESIDSIVHDVQEAGGIIQSSIDAPERWRTETHLALQEIAGALREVDDTIAVVRERGIVEARSRIAATQHRVGEAAGPLVERIRVLRAMPTPVPVEHKRGDQTRPDDLPAECSSIWDALSGVALTGPELAKRQASTETAIRASVVEIRKRLGKTAIGHRRGYGYFRPDAPPGWESLKPKPRKKRVDPTR